jgi:dihydrofolate synthase / folylpolyglutamate synthase
MTYPQALQYLESFINYEKVPAYPYKESLKLERVSIFLETIGNPQDHLKCIHVSGTKGKGSTCAFIAYILRQAGFRVGLYTSPHLMDFRERIRILSHKDTRTTPGHKGLAGARSCAQGHKERDFEGMISEKEFVEVIDKLKPSMEEYNKDSEYGPLTFFEVTTSAAFKFFAQQQVDFAVLETGLGGRLDATNTVDALACAITPISYEHMDKLGLTLREIATEKAGIIKSHKDTKSQGHKLSVISAPQEKVAIEVIRKKCEETGAKLYEVNKDIFYERTRQGFNVIAPFNEYPHLETRLLGEHQMINAAVAIGVIESLRFHDILLGVETIREGMANTVWPGRCEVISQKPLIVLDGAQNEASAAVLKKTVRENFNYKRLILVLGISQDKDIKGICRVFRDLADSVVLTKADNPRAAEPKALAGYFENRVVHLAENVKQAKEISKSIARKDDLILVTGSLFVVGEFRNAGV